jgi:hypothetical protein
MKSKLLQKIIKRTPWPKYPASHTHDGRPKSLYQPPATDKAGKMTRRTLRDVKAPGRTAPQSKRRRLQLKSGAEAYPAPTPPGASRP